MGGGFGGGGGGGGGFSIPLDPSMFQGGNGGQMGFEETEVMKKKSRLGPDAFLDKIHTNTRTLTHAHHRGLTFLCCFLAAGDWARWQASHNL